MEMQLVRIMKKKTWGLNKKVYGFIDKPNLSHFVSQIKTPL